MTGRQHQHLFAMVGSALVGGLVVAVVVGTNTARARSNAPAVVEAERFILKDAEGREWAHLRVLSSGPELSLLGPDGHRMINLAVTPQGPGIVLGDLENRDAPNAVLMVSKSGSPQFNLNGRGNIALRITPQEGQKIYIFDEAKKVLFEAPVPGKEPATPK
jgi:hypothetical protein